MDLKERAELYQNIFHIFYICALGYGAILIVALLILGTVFFFIMWRNAFSKDFEKKENVLIRDLHSNEIIRGLEP